MSFFDDLAALTQPQPTAGLSPQQQTALDLNSVGTNTDALGQVIGGLSHITFGLQANQGQKFQAAQLRQNASDAQASGQRAAIDEDRRTQLVNSAALASAAASGGGATDPTVVNIMARTASEGAYRQAAALYQGNARARLDQLQANAKEYEGKNTALNSAMVGGAQFFGAGTTLLKGAAKGASLYERFGGGGPKINSGAPSDNGLWANNGPGE